MIYILPVLGGILIGIAGTLVVLDLEWWTGPNQQGDPVPRGLTIPRLEPDEIGPSECETCGHPAHFPDRCPYYTTAGPDLEPCECDEIETAQDRATLAAFRTAFTSPDILWVPAEKVRSSWGSYTMDPSRHGRLGRTPPAPPPEPVHVGPIVDTLDEIHERLAGSDEPLEYDDRWFRTRLPHLRRIPDGRTLNLDDTPGDHD